MSELRKIKIDDIRAWGPCYDPVRHLPEGWEGSALDVLRHETIPASDKLWVVCREELIDAKNLRLFAVWCARQVEHLVNDERSTRALDTAERYAHGIATKEELVAARAAASAAAWDARAAAWDAWVAARAAARAAAWDARAAAWDAARVAARDAQVAKLIKMLEAK